MIFVTVGEQLPFDRLVRAIDVWAEDLQADVFAQIGNTNFKPVNIRYESQMPFERYRSCMQKAEVIVAHAGMGTILTALEFNKPLLVMPRDAKLQEVRNDHQFGTARRFATLDLVQVAYNSLELSAKLNQFLNVRPARPEYSRPEVSSRLLEYIEAFVEKAR